MHRKSQFKSGLKTSKDFSWSEREKIVKEYLRSSQTKQAIWEKYSGQSEEHGQLIKWMRRLGYEKSPPRRRRPQRKDQMSIKSNRSNKSNRSKSSEEDATSSELRQLRAQIASLEQQLQDSQLEATAYRKMISIAEQSLKIKIRKKSNTKPSK